MQVIENRVYRTVPGADLRADVYRPWADGRGPKPVVILLHGVGPELKQRPKDWGVYRSWGRLLAASGMVAVTFNHRFGFSAPDLENALADVESLTAFVRARAASWGGDPERIAYVSYSAGGMLLAPPIRRRPSWLRCIVAMYPIFDPRVLSNFRQQLPREELQEHSLGRHLATSASKMAPLLLVRAGRDESPDLLAGVDRFVEEALSANVPFVLANHPEASHGCDNDAPSPRTLEVLSMVVAFLRERLEDESVPRQDAAGTVELYKPNYFTFFHWTEGHQPRVKFQFSIRTTLLPKFGLCVGYTQESFWDLYSSSSPFDEHDFNPELFVVTREDGWTIRGLQRVWKGFQRAQCGWEHQSTGVGGPASRSWNRVYGSLRAQLLQRGAYEVRIYPRLWWIWDAAQENADISRTTSFIRETRLGGNLIVVLRIGDRSRFSVESGRSYQLYEAGVRPFLNQQRFHLYARLWNGLGDGLVDYGRFTRSASVGISLLKD